MTEDIIIRLDLPGLQPDGVSASSLAALLRDWEKAVSAEIALDVDQDVSDADVPFVSLVSVRDECAAYGLKFGPHAGQANRRLITGLARGGDAWADVSPAAQETMHRLIRRFTNEHTSFTIDTKSTGLPTVTFSPGQLPPAVNRTRFAEAPTTRSVKVVKAGGIRPAATVELIGGKYRIPVQGNKRVIQTLGSKLYEKVLLSGKAQWRLSDWKIVLIKADEVKPYPTSGIAEVLRETAAASGTTWAQANGISGFLSEMRNEDEDEDEE